MNVKKQMVLDQNTFQDHLFFRVFLKNKRGKPRILCPPQNSQDPKDKHVEHPKNVFSFQFLKIYFYQVSCFLVQFVRSIKKNRFVNQVCHVWEMCHTRSVWETCCTRTRTRSFFLLTNIENRSVWKLTGQPPVTDPVNFLPPLSVLPSLSVVVRLLLTLKNKGGGPVNSLYTYVWWKFLLILSIWIFLLTVCLVWMCMCDHHIIHMGVMLSPSSPVGLLDTSYDVT